MRKLLKLTAALALVAVAVYYTAEVLIARARTPDIVAGLLQSDRMKLHKSDLTERQLAILLQVQDPGFWAHHGVDFSTPGQGWTTLTQALAKRFYFDEFKPGIRKIKQTLCARLALDPLVPKDTQITLFLNLMYFGNGQYGLQDAARYYFEKDFEELSEDEFISLLASLNKPAALNPKTDPTANAERVRRIKRVVAGDYKPTGLFDIDYEGA